MPDLEYRVKIGEVLPPDTQSVRGVYKEPLSPVEKGFGYYGTLMRTLDDRHLQCHVCGYFFSSLGTHASKSHGLPPKEYREKFGLNRTSKLVSGLERIQRRKSFEALDDATKQKILENVHKGRSHRSNTHPGRRFSPSRLEEHNKRGTCPDQLLDKLEILNRELGRTPSTREFIKRWKVGLYSVKLQYGSWTEMLQVAGLEPLPSGWLARRLKTGDA